MKYFRITDIEGGVVVKQHPMGAAISKLERRKMNNFLRSVFAWLVISTLISGLIHAQTIDEIYNRFIKRYHTYQSTTFPYYIFVPATYNPKNHYPLVLCLHGAGECGDNPSAVEKNSMATVWARDSNQTRWPCFILVPQCPISEWWANTNMILAVNDIIRFSPD